VPWIETFNAVLTSITNSSGLQVTLLEEGQQNSNKSWLYLHHKLNLLLRPAHPILKSVQIGCCSQEEEKKLNPTKWTLRLRDGIMKYISNISIFSNTFTWVNPSSATCSLNMAKFSWIANLEVQSTSLLMFFNQKCVLQGFVKTFQQSSHY